MQTTTTTEIHQLNPRDLTLNPALASVPMMSTVAASLLGSKNNTTKQAGADLMSERDALWSSLDRDKIIEPIKCHKDGKALIVDDGRHRLEWAIARGEATVPVVYVTEAQGTALVESTVIGRRHWTKGQRAYLGVLLHPEVAAASKGQPKKSDSVGLIRNASDLAERLGVSPDVVHQACELYRHFHAPGCKPTSAEAIEAATKKERYEMSIWAGAGLGAVLAGIGGGEETLGKPRPASSFQALDKPLGTLARLSQVFVKWDEGERTKAEKFVTAKLKESLHPDFRLFLAECLAASE